eukprot:1215894-Rhodomonas_salina.2
MLVPACVPRPGKARCFTLAYTPAPRNQYSPATDFKHLSHFSAHAPDGTCGRLEPQCSQANCNAILIPNQVIILLMHGSGCGRPEPQCTKANCNAIPVPKKTGYQPIPLPNQGTLSPYQT